MKLFLTIIFAACSLLTPITILFSTNYAVTSNELTAQHLSEKIIKSNKVHFQIQNTTAENAELELLKLIKNPLHSLSIISSFVDTPYAYNFLKFCASNFPDETISRLNGFKHKYYATDILKRIAFESPVTLKRYLANKDHLIHVFLKNSSDPFVQAIYQIHESKGIQSNAYYLIELIINNELNIDQAHDLSNSSTTLIPLLTRIINKKNYAAKYSIEKYLEHYSLKKIRSANYLSAGNVSNAFDSINSMKADIIYLILTSGKEEIFTNSFTSIIPFLLKENTFQLLTEMNFYKFRTFIELLILNNKWVEISATFAHDQKDELLTRFVRDLNYKDNFEQVLTVVNSLSNLKDQYSGKYLLAALQKNEIKYKNDPAIRNIYQILIDILYNNKNLKLQHELSVTYGTDFNKTKSEKLFIKDQNVQVYYFYNDEDGKQSYDNFLDEYKNDTNWKIDEQKDFVCIKSIFGKEIEIYATKPEYESEGSTSINNLLTKNSKTATVYVHRGHSFHTEKSINKFTSDAQIVFLGSCGGFYKSNIAHSFAPEAFIISTKQIGTKFINDSILKCMNERLRNEQDIDWPLFWDSLPEKIKTDPNFADYIGPHMNSEIQFLNIFYSKLRL